MHNPPELNGLHPKNLYFCKLFDRSNWLYKVFSLSNPQILSKQKAEIDLPHYAVIITY